MANECLVLIMKCIQRKIPEITEFNLWDVAKGNGVREFVKWRDHLDKNPLFEGKDKPTQPDRWNTWVYVGPRHDQG